MTGPESLVDAADIPCPASCFFDIFSAVSPEVLLGEDGLVVTVDSGSGESGEGGAGGVEVGGGGG